MMTQQLPSSFVLSQDVAGALRSGHPVVALESAVITHGLPRPQNYQLAQALEQEVRQQGATPATVGLMDGKVHVGLSTDELVRLANEDGARKISRRDFGIALARGENGGTTVAGTLIAARLSGIRVFATGGIGGVHRNAPFDMSADLPELGRSPLVVVCAGAKSILDLPATVEVLETMGVAVIGFGTDQFPAFFSRESGLPVNVRVDHPREIAEIARQHWLLGLESALLVVQPPPADVALPSEQIEGVIEQALDDAEQQKISGAGVTPFLLDRVNRLSGGASLQANLALLRSNASLAAQIARELYPRKFI
jgi:pseudouridine-5'-phosphate glycosidase